jgi:hypothetical protein
VRGKETQWRVAAEKCSPTFSRNKVVKSELARTGGMRSMSDPDLLRQMAARMFAVALSSRDKKLAERLTLRASDYLDQAAELERAKLAITQKAQQPPPEKME